jgi:alkylation response protein AidB-like acyl-CoA dehydrogenase
MCKISNTIGEQTMNFEHSDKTKELLSKIQQFMDDHLYEGEKTYHQQHEEMSANGKRWEQPPVLDELKAKAKKAGLWNLFLPESEYGYGLTNLEYAPLSELMGTVGIASEVFNCSAPDTGNMEVLDKYGTDEQKKEWLEPLLAGEIRSAFGMTEPNVASSDATNISSSIVEDGDEYVINGEKWWTSGAGDPRCKIIIFMGVSNPDNPKHQRQSQILVPMDTPGVEILRMMTVFGNDDAPHGHAHMKFTNVRVPKSNMILGEGRGFEIAQGRLGPGRIHHCMRTIGLAEVALEAMCKRLMSRKAFGKEVVRHSVWQERIADARINIEMTRLLTLKAATMMDEVGNKVAKNEIAMIKVAAPNMALKIIDDAIQAFGGAGVTTDPHLAQAYAGMRTLRLADGPDEVHRLSIARNELKKYL